MKLVLHPLVKQIEAAEARADDHFTPTTRDLADAVIALFDAVAIEGRDAKPNRLMQREAERRALRQQLRTATSAVDIDRLLDAAGVRRLP